MLSLLKVALPEIDTAGEVQMGTPYVTVWTDWERDVVTKGLQSKNVKKYAQRLAKYYMMLSDIRNEMLPSCPQFCRKEGNSPILLVMSAYSGMTFAQTCSKHCNFLVLALGVTDIKNTI